MNPASLVGLSPAECAVQVTKYFAEQRSSLLSAGIATSKAVDGMIPENTFGAARGEDGLRTSVVQSQQVCVSKNLLPDFRLVIKHPGLFTAILEPLRQSFKCFAVVRNPLSMLLSWHSCKAPVNRGRVPAAEAFDHALKAALDAEADPIERQMLILQWFYSRYSSLLPRERVIRYEDIVDSGGRALSVMDPDAGALDVKLESMNLSSRYDRSLVKLLADRLLQSKAAFAEYYPVSAIEELRDQWLDRAT
jgi:hypothetical protein